MCITERLEMRPRVSGYRRGAARVVELFAFLVAYAASAIVATHVSAASRALPRSASLPYFASTAFATACVVSCASFQTLVSSTVLGCANLN